MCAPSPPKPPDPKETSAASTSTNVGTAIANANLGNVNQVTPDGSLTYDQTGTYTWNDPYTGKSYEIPRYTATQSLTPEGQAIHDTNVGTQQNLADIGNQQSDFLKGFLSNPIDLSSGNVEKYIDNHFGDDFNKQWGQQQDQLLTRLANQGIGAGSEAYQNALDQFSTQRGNAYDNLYGNQYQNAVKDITAERSQPINEITALLSGSQVAQPNLVNTNMPTIPTTDVAGLINTNYNQKLGAYQQQMAQRNGILGGLFGLGSAGIIASDRRLKKDIKKIGKTDDGQNLYSYKYKAGGPTQVGLMAQEVKKRKPEAVHDIGGGLMGVDYAEALS